MKAVRYDADAEPRLGRLEGDTVVDAGPAPASGWMRETGWSAYPVGPAPAGGFVPSEEGWAAIAGASGPEYALRDVRLLHPVDPAKLIGIGLNYRDHAEESDLAIPDVPVVFAMWPSALIGHGDPIMIPRDETRPDYEGEVAIVLGHGVTNASLDEARAAIGGISAFNDVSGRRAQLETPLRQFTLGKSFDTFAPMGPCIASLDDLDLGNLGIRTTVSGEVLQESNTRNLVFSPEEIVAYCSRGVTLEEGTVIATGTPGGVGDSRDPKRYLQENDVVEVWVEGVGTLENDVIHEIRD